MAAWLEMVDAPDNGGRKYSRSSRPLRVRVPSPPCLHLCGGGTVQGCGGSPVHGHNGLPVHCRRFAAVQRYSVANLRQCTGCSGPGRAGGSGFARAVSCGMDDETALAEIRRAARAVLDAWPEARAAVLFGSRARGTHRANSDWDIAFITAGDGDRCGTVPHSVPFRCANLGTYVNHIAIPEKLVERTALSIGHVGRGIARDGRILAGDWSRPAMEGTPLMDAGRYMRSLYASLARIARASEAAAAIEPTLVRYEILERTDQFVAATADAAEHLAKAVMGRHGIDAWHTHDLNDLATQARRAGLGVLADDLVRMNGATRTDHTAVYSGADADSLAHAIDRLPVILDLMGRELAALPAGFLDRQETTDVLGAAARQFRESAVALRAAIERDGADMALPEPDSWIAALVRAREGLGAALDDAANALGKGDWQPPEPSPFTDPDDPFQPG